jgi:hypothetical protein
VPVGGEEMLPLRADVRVAVLLRLESRRSGMGSAKPHAVDAARLVTPRSASRSDTSPTPRDTPTPSYRRT